MIMEDSIETKLENSNDVRKDTWFKDMIEFKGVVAVLLKFVMRELKQYTYTEIASFIVDREDRDKSKDVGISVLEEKVDFDRNEFGFGDNKKIIYDSVLHLKVENREDKEYYISIGDLLTVNLEMQTSKPSYTLEKRAMYYAATLLTRTIKAAGNYDSLHKIYTIWLLDYNKNFRKYNNQDNQFVHHYNMYRRIDDFNVMDMCNQDIDLIEVTFVELPKIAKNERDAVEDLVYKFLNDRHGFIQKLEKIENVTLTRLESEVSGMSRWEERCNKVEEELSKAKEQYNQIEEGLSKACTLLVKDRISSGMSKEDAVNEVVTIMGNEKLRERLLQLI